MPGITNAGFEAKNFNQIKEELENNFRDIFGNGINISSTSILGQLIGILANNENNIYELASDEYLNRFPDTATGQSLDRLVNFLNIIRKQDFRTSGIVYLIGTQGTVIPQGTTFSDGNNLVFDTLEQVTLGPGTAPILRIARQSGIINNTLTLTPRNNFFGLFTIETTPISITYDDSISNIQTVLESYFGSGSITSVVRDSNNELVITFTNNIFLPAFFHDGFNITYDRAGFADGNSVSVASQVPGPILASIGQINTIVTAVTGLTAVRNFEDFTIGRLAETDTELRTRWTRRTRSPITGSDDAIEIAIEALDGVSQAIVSDVEGRYAIRVIVNGGSEDNIAQAIFNNKPPGIATEGSVIGLAINRHGNQVPIAFDRPTIISFYVRITLDTQTNFPADGQTAIRQLLIEYQNNLRIGGIVRPSPDMVWALRGIQGINSLQIEISPRNKNNFSENPYQLGSTEFANFVEVSFVDAN